MQADECDVVQALPQVHIGVAGQDLAAEGVALGSAALGIVFHAAHYAQAPGASGSRGWQCTCGRMTPAAECPRRGRRQLNAASRQRINGVPRQLQLPGVLGGSHDRIKALLPSRLKEVAIGRLMLDTSGA
jgi:hypothetical protein